MVLRQMMEIVTYGRVIDRLKAKTGSSRAKVAAILSSTMCEVFASHTLTSKTQASDRFDPYYQEKHELAKRKLIDRLKTVLTRAGISFQLLTEEPAGLGRHDVAITTNPRGLTIQSREHTVIVEIKASLGLGLSQVERYLMEGERVLLIRVMTGQAILLNSAEYSNFLDKSAADLSEKGECILNDSPVQVFGYEYRECTITSCSYNKLVKCSRRLVCMGSEEFGEDLGLFLCNLYPTIEKAVELILDELGISATVSLRQVAR